MRHEGQAGFCLETGSIRSGILIPRYYDPRIAEQATALSVNNTLVTLDELIRSGELEHSHGKYIPKIHYGTGPYPYIRTSDLANWEVRSSPKHGVSAAVYSEYSERLDVQPLDIFFVHEGTYLIGRTALVTEFDGPCLYQHHLAKFRVIDTARLDAYLLLAALNSPFVQRQIRSKQFSADIIDSVVGRLGELLIPIPKTARVAEQTSEAVRDAVVGRARDRERASHFFGVVERSLRNDEPGEIERAREWNPSPDAYRGTPAFLGGHGSFRAFSLSAAELQNSVLVPKYYDPSLTEIARDFGSLCDLVSIGELHDSGILHSQMGHEIGKIHYGSGDIPFIRTSDLGSFELRADPKHCVAPDVYNRLRDAQDVGQRDILMVRDGTYLVGTSVMLFEADLPMMFSAGIIKFRVRDEATMPRGLFYALLNTPYVQRQIKSKKFTRDVIDTLGSRYREILLPIPRDPGLRQHISEFTEGVCADRIGLRHVIPEVSASFVSG